MLIMGCAERASSDAGRGLSAVLGKSMEVYFKRFASSLFAAACGVSSLELVEWLWQTLRAGSSSPLDRFGILP